MDFAGCIIGRQAVSLIEPTDYGIRVTIALGDGRCRVLLEPFAPHYEKERDARLAELRAWMKAGALAPAYPLAASPSPLPDAFPPMHGIPPWPQPAPSPATPFLPNVVYCGDITAVGYGPGGPMQLHSGGPGQQFHSAGR